VPWSCTENVLPLFVQATYEKLQAEVPKYKMITPSVLSDRLRVSCQSISCGWPDLAAAPTWLIEGSKCLPSLYTQQALWHSRPAAVTVPSSNRCGLNYFGSVPSEHCQKHNMRILRG